MKTTDVANIKKALSDAYRETQGILWQDYYQQNSKMPASIRLKYIDSVFAAEAAIVKLAALYGFDVTTS